ncbi:site-specific DNA-methyltransferase, partial [Fimbriimonadia bacterium ATM]|nr:site-specific DNA-methyltransferase [Fimbriimonadia bacterium ATM]
QRDVKDGKDEDLTREVMQVQAFRDTWELGVHSYLTYLRDRLLLARELLKDEGSIFVQIGDENVHRVRCLMDEVFGEENFCSLITFTKTSGQAESLLASVSDYLLWYGKDKTAIKYRQLFLPKGPLLAGGSAYRRLLASDGSSRLLTPDEIADPTKIPEDSRIFRQDNISSQRTAQGADVRKFDFQGRSFSPGSSGTFKTDAVGLARLANAGRLQPSAATQISYVRFLDDFPAFRLADNWPDTTTSGSALNKQYAVETSQKIVARCILMTTDPGDLVLDPTCGSGTTAYVAEQWGRRWITMDTSRVALAIARHRLMTAAFDYYKLRHPTSGVSGGFVYKTVPHITLKSIAQNTEIDTIAAEFQPKIDEALASVNEAFSTDAKKKAWQEWEVPRSVEQVTGSRQVGSAGANQDLVLRRFWDLKREMQARIDASIARNAPTEELVDQPEKERGIVRVAGPFTVEAVPNVSAEFAVTVEYEVVPSDDGERDEAPPLELTTFAPAEPNESVVNASAYISDMIEKLRKTGVVAKGGKRLEFESLKPIDHPVIHAEGETRIKNGAANANGKSMRCAVVFGPQNGAISELIVREATTGAKKFDALLLCGYDFTDGAQQVINVEVAGLKVLMAYINPDTAMSDLLKDSKASQLFTMVGEPDVVVYRKDDPSLGRLLEEAKRRSKEADGSQRTTAEEVLKRAEGLKEGEVFIELRGVDLYDPLSGEAKSDSGANVHALFIDHDFDGKSFCICQALFPNKKDSWEKLERNLRGTVDPEAFEAMRTLVSLPFKPGERVQVKVIDARGNAVVKTIGVAVAP